jgi:hypothetical protein
MFDFLVGCTYALLRDYGKDTVATPFRNFIFKHVDRIVKRKLEE